MREGGSNGSAGLEDAGGRRSAGPVAEAKGERGQPLAKTITSCSQVKVDAYTQTGDIAAHNPLILTSTRGQVDN